MIAALLMVTRLRNPGITLGRLNLTSWDLWTIGNPNITHGYEIAWSMDYAGSTECGLSDQRGALEARSVVEAINLKTRSDPAPYCPVHPLRRSGPGPLPRALPRRPGREAASTNPATAAVPTIDLAGLLAGFDEDADAPAAVAPRAARRRPHPVDATGRTRRTPRRRCASFATSLTCAPC